MLKHIHPDAIPPIDESQGPTIPGRQDLRISLTRSCNLRCQHCHNEGQIAPWKGGKDVEPVSVESIVNLIRFASQYGVKSVKFTGGDPGVYRAFAELMAAIPSLRAEYPGIKKWGISTNGVPFLNPRKYEVLANSALDNICIGIDSVDPGEFSKPSSPVGVLGKKVMDGFVSRLSADWADRDIKINVVFTGNRDRVLNVVRAARSLDVNVSVIEVNRVMDVAYDVRRTFLDIASQLATDYGLEPRLYEPLNEIYLYDKAGGSPIKFYQDHCTDLDCGNCRKVHLRISPSGQGWGAVPCFLQTQADVIPLVVDGKLSRKRFEDVIRLNGTGPEWYIGTEYDNRLLTM